MNWPYGSEWRIGVQSKHAARERQSDRPCEGGSACGVAGSKPLLVCLSCGGNVTRSRHGWKCRFEFCLHPNCMRALPRLVEAHLFNCSQVGTQKPCLECRFECRCKTSAECPFSTQHGPFSLRMAEAVNCQSASTECGHSALVCFPPRSLYLLKHHDISTTSQRNRLSPEDPLSSLAITSAGFR